MGTRQSDQVGTAACTKSRTAGGLNLAMVLEVFLLGWVRVG